LCTRDGKTFCFVEDFVYKTGKAHITALEISGTNIVERGIALDEPDVAPEYRHRLKLE